MPATGPATITRRRSAPFVLNMRPMAAAVVIGLALLPPVILGIQSVAGRWLWPALLPPAWNLRAWEDVFHSSSGVLASLTISAGIALSVTLFSLLIALPAARALAFANFRGKGAFLFLLLLPVLAPPLASAMGLHQVFLQLGLTGHWAGVALVHLIPALPYATLLLTGSFSRLDLDLEAQARTLGAGRLAVLRHVTIPQLAPGIAIAAGFAFLISWSQYILTLLIGSGQVVTLPLVLVSAQRAGDQALAAAVCLVFLAPPALLFLLTGRWLHES